MQKGPHGSGPRPWTPADDRALAEKHVLQGEARCARQATLIARLRDAGADATEAERTLISLEDTLTRMRAHAQRLRESTRTCP